MEYTQHVALTLPRPNRIIPERRGMVSNCSEAMPYFFAIVAPMFLSGPEPLLPVDGRQGWTE